MRGAYLFNRAQLYFTLLKCVFSKGGRSPPRQGDLILSPLWRCNEVSDFNIRKNLLTSDRHFIKCPAYPHKLLDVMLVLWLSTNRNENINVLWVIRPLIGGRLFILTTFLNLTIQQEGKILHTEAVLGNVQIHSSAAKCSHFWKFQIFFEFPSCGRCYT